MIRLARLAVPLALAVAFLEQGSALAATTNVSMVNFAFNPSTATVAEGDTVQWTNATATTSHTSTSDSTNPDGSTGIALWSSGTVGPSGTFSFTLVAAGTYPYHCIFHASSGMVGTARVKLKVSPTTGPTGTTFTVTVASVTAPSGFVYDVQRKDPGGSFKDWMTGITARKVTFTPTAAGTYSFRSRMRRLSNNGASLYSPSKSITVSA